MIKITGYSEVITVAKDKVIACNRDGFSFPSDSIVSSLIKLIEKG